MAHFAQLNQDNVVTQVIVVNNETIGNAQFPQSEQIGVEFCQSLFGSDTVWKQTSYNASFRKNYAGIGFSYDDGRDAFISPRPFPSWSLDEASCQWKAPVSYPEDNNIYIWDEPSLSWVAISN